MSYIFSILGIAVGTILVIKSEWFYENFGTIQWAEEHVGGGSRLMYKLIGIVISIIGILGVTGQLGAVVLGIFGRLFGMK